MSSPWRKPYFSINPVLLVCCWGSLKKVCLFQLILCSLEHAVFIIHYSRLGKEETYRSDIQLLCYG